MSESDRSGASRDAVFIGHSPEDICGGLLVAASVRPVLFCVSAKPGAYTHAFLEKRSRLHGPSQREFDMACKVPAGTAFARNERLVGF
jgi:hypothetical protein